MNQTTKSILEVVAGLFSFLVCLTGFALFVYGYSHPSLKSLTDMLSGIVFGLLFASYGTYLYFRFRKNSTRRMTKHALFLVAMGILIICLSVLRTLVP